MPDTKDVLRTTDDDARQHAKTLMRTARHAALAVLDPSTGAPQASRVSIACLADGAPVILISQLSAHFAALQADPRCSLLFGEPATGDPLAHPRVSVSATAERIIPDARTKIRERFLRYHPKASLYADFGDFAFWRLVPTGASLNAGFGRAFALTADDLRTPLTKGFEEQEPELTAYMNADHKDMLALYAGKPGVWTLLGLDAEGLDLAQGEARLRHWFGQLTDAPETLREALVALVKQKPAENS